MAREPACLMDAFEQLVSEILDSAIPYESLTHGDLV